MENLNSDKIDEKDIYREHYATYRQLNGVLYQFPVLFSTILGGLYYFGFLHVDSNRFISVFIFLFSSLTSFLFLIMVNRFGHAFSRYINQINKFDSDHKITLKNLNGVSILEALRRLLGLLCFAGVCLAIGTCLSIFDSEKMGEKQYFVCNNCVIEKQTDPHNSD